MLKVSDRWQERRQAAAIFIFGLVLVILGTPTSGKASADVYDPTGQGVWCQQQLAKGGWSVAATNYLLGCVETHLPAPTPTPTGTPTPTPTGTPTPTPTTTTPPVTTPPVTTPPVTTPPATTPPPGPSVCPAYPAFVTISCTGYKHTGVVPKVCNELDGENDGHFTRTQTFDGCLITGFIRIRAANIVIKNSLIRGNLAPHWTAPQQYMGLKVIDTEITTAVPNAAPIADGNDYSCLRCYVHDTSTGIGGGNNVTIEDSYVDRMVYSAGAHQATVGMNYGRNIKIIHNTLDCWRVFPAGVPQNQGCSAALSLYDEGTMDGVLVKNNWFRSAGEYCVYTGGPTARNVRFEGNRFAVTRFDGAPRPRCGNAGPVHSWYPGNVGYVWLSNSYEDGRVISP